MSLFITSYLASFQDGNLFGYQKLKKSIIPKVSCDLRLQNNKYYDSIDIPSCNIDNFFLKCEIFIATIAKSSNPTVSTSWKHRNISSKHQADIVSLVSAFAK